MNQPASRLNLPGPHRSGRAPRAVWPWEVVNSGALSPYLSGLTPRAIRYRPNPGLGRIPDGLRATIHRDSRRESGDCSEKDSGPAHSSTGKPAITRATAPGDAMRRTYCAYCARLRRVQMRSMDCAVCSHLEIGPTRPTRERGSPQVLAALGTPLARSLVGLVWPAGIHRTFLGWSFTRLSPYCAYLRTRAARSNVRSMDCAVCSRRRARTWQPVVNLSRASRYTCTRSRSSFASASRSPGHSASTSAHNWRASA